jgi:hypothetical protein
MRDLKEGFGTLRRSLGLVPLLLCVNLALAALLALPLARALARDLRNTDAAARMTTGFDYDWWSEWSQRQKGYARHLSPELLGLGFAAKNLELLLKGQLPAGLFAFGDPPGARPSGAGDRSLDPLVLGLGLVSWLVQLCLTGGVLGIFRAAQGRFTVRGLLHGSSFYAGRLIRIGLLAMGAAGLVFALFAPISHFAEARAREAVSETAALSWSLARYALLLLALGFVHMVSSYAKVVLVVEDRQSAVFSFVSGAALALRNLGPATVQYVGVAFTGGVLLLVWGSLESSFEPTGFRTGLLFFVAAEAFVAARVALRLWLLASQVALHRRSAPLAAAFVTNEGMR